MVGHRTSKGPKKAQGEGVGVGAVHGFLNTVSDFSVPSFIIMGFFFFLH